MKKLTPQQIEQLYIFTKQHYVAYYDLQTELVDHLANGIEEQWQENETLTFEDALQKEFKKYGIYGFSDIIEKKQSEMHKKYYKILFRFMRQWFQLPKVMITLTLFMFFFLVLGIPYGKLFVVIIILISMIFDFIRIYKRNKKTKKATQKTQKRWMLNEMISNTSRGASWMFPINIINGINIFDTINEEAMHTLWLKILIASVLTLSIIIAYITAEVLPKNADALLKETYPEYGLSE